MDKKWIYDEVDKKWVFENEIFLNERNGNIKKIEEIEKLRLLNEFDIRDRLRGLDENYNNICLPPSYNFVGSEYDYEWGMRNEWDGLMEELKDLNRRSFKIKNEKRWKKERNKFLKNWIYFLENNSRNFGEIKFEDMKESIRKFNKNKKVYLEKVRRVLDDNRRRLLLKMNDN